MQPRLKHCKIFLTVASTAWLKQVYHMSSCPVKMYVNFLTNHVWKICTRINHFRRNYA